MKVQHSLKVSLHGMNDRMQKMMASYLELNCKGIAYVVDESEAEAEIVDVDLAQSKNILHERLAQRPAKPIIAISLYGVSSIEAIYVKKPIEVDNLVNAIKKVKKSIPDNKAALSMPNLYAGSSIPEVSTLLKQDKHTETKKTVNNKRVFPPEFELSESDDFQSIANKNLKSAKKSAKKSAQQRGNQAKPKSNTPLPKKSKTEVSKSSSDVVSINSTRPRPEIDNFLNEFNRSIHKKVPKKVSSSKSIANNRRNTVRYVFQAITGCLKKNSLIGFNQSLPVLVQAISSKGALIKLEKTLKLNRKVTLEIQLDSRHIFTIPATVIRQNSTTTYGLSFVDYQHKLTDYLISSGRSFNIK